MSEIPPLPPGSRPPGPKPLIGLPACIWAEGEHPFHKVGDKYVRAVALAAAGTPVMIPSLETLIDMPDLLSRLDGIVMTGSPSNVHPDLYGQLATEEHEPYDPARDATTLPLIATALSDGVPLFAICRGFQELNVALGGSLHAAVHDIPGRLSHRSPKDPDPDVNYGPRHGVTLTEGGLLHGLAGSREVMVNSLHRQAIDNLAPGLTVEAVAEDGTIEAVRVEAATAFALGVQWHPEYKVLNDPFSVAIFRAFGQAARERMLERSRWLTAPQAAK